MTDTLTPEQIAYVRAWAESGNEPRTFGNIPLGVRESGLVTQGSPSIHDQHLSPAGLTIAAQARRIEELAREALLNVERQYRAEAHSVGAARECHRLREENARLREAFEQACDAAEEVLYETGWHESIGGSEAMHTMRANYAELIR